MPIYSVILREEGRGGGGGKGGRPEEKGKEKMEKDRM